MNNAPKGNTHNALLDDLDKQVAFAVEKALAGGDFSDFEGFLDEDTLWFFPRTEDEPVRGKDAVLGYWKKWREKGTEEKKEICYEVKWCTYYHRNVLCISSPGTDCIYVVCLIENDKITRAINVPRVISRYETLDNMPLDYAFAMEHSLGKIAEAKKNAIPCLSCGTQSEYLDWHKIGFMLSSSSHFFEAEIAVCPNCHKVIETHPVWRCNTDSDIVFSTCNLLSEELTQKIMHDLMFQILETNVERFIDPNYDFYERMLENQELIILSGLTKEQYKKKVVEVLAAYDPRWKEHVNEWDKKAWEKEHPRDFEDYVLMDFDTTEDSTIDFFPTIGENPVIKEIVMGPNDKFRYRKLIFHTDKLPTLIHLSPLIKEEEEFIYIYEYEECFKDEEERCCVNGGNFSLYEMACDFDEYTLYALYKYSNDDYMSIKKCYMAAYEDGISEAANYLGIMAYYIEQDKEQGLRYLTSATYCNNENALENLAEICREENRISLFLNICGKPYEKLTNPYETKARILATVNRHFINGGNKDYTKVFTSVFPGIQMLKDGNFLSVGNWTHNRVYAANVYNFFPKISDEETEYGEFGFDLYNFVTVCNLDAAWGVYLLMDKDLNDFSSPFCGYRILNISDLLRIDELRYRALSWLKKTHIIEPQVVKENLQEGCNVHIYCCYWYFERGLVREHTVFKVKGRKIIDVSKKEDVCLFEYGDYSLDMFDSLRQAKYKEAEKANWYYDVSTSTHVLDENENESE